MKRSDFIQRAGLLSAGLLFNQNLFASVADWSSLRPVPSKRNFKSKAVEAAIEQFKAGVKDKELAWLFENCFPNTLDTTVFFSQDNGLPDTYVITGDIDAMWLRDSCAQVWPYLTFLKQDEELKNMVAGVINRQMKCILKDPYANAFYKDGNKESEWKNDHTDMKPGVHERKWEIDSLCYPIRLAYHYWKRTGDTAPFNNTFKSAIALILQVFTAQQRKNGNRGEYHFQRETLKPTDTLPMDGYGFPVKPTGLICSMFRPSDDATTYSFLIPSNFFAVVSLKQAAEMVKAIFNDDPLAGKLNLLATEVETALQKHAMVNHPKFGKIYAFEVDGFGNVNLMDDANIPGLLSLPYLGAVPVNDPVYQNTRSFVLSDSNPYYYQGQSLSGVGGPHVGKADMIWPLSIICRGLTSIDDSEIKLCIRMLKGSHAGTGFMHESFNKNNPADFTRKWFAWANTIFGEFLWETYQAKPHLLNA
ncbi:glycoside hydrolase family 125 protein [Mucilaginibacter paludis]|uniref:Uncharacterized conserved protein UCP028846 n=1 Tax=Mucilaginibacter paludis DSM 18603 TaxID=714943 RepID=H1Y8B9_9SPHI|nr:glycoside hydrolase family 125 protein [Mucilaginibacter paludis]EHQ24938.1 Uncharacterized conserved protein UCP028846 [Mucilaginibacter paludis DSM 18603]